MQSKFWSQAFETMYAVFNAVFPILETRPKVCQCDKLHKVNNYLALWKNRHFFLLRIFIKHSIYITLKISTGFIWALQPNGDIYTFSSGLEKCSQLQSPSYRKPIVCLCTSRDAVWVLMEDGAVFIRSGVRPSNPQGVDWCKLDLSQLGQ